jgi:hypothetical protein
MLLLQEIQHQLPMQVKQAQVQSDRGQVKAVFSQLLEQRSVLLLSSPGAGHAER